MKKIIFATGNAGKMKEIREILSDLDAEVLSMKEAGVQADIVEDGKTFEENAVIKAKAVCELTHEIALADDSGLEIDYLNKNIKANFKQADKLNTKYVIIVGEEEVKSNILTIKNNQTKEEYKIKQEEMIDFFDHKIEE